jgi:hypothetical protein
MADGEAAKFARRDVLKQFVTVAGTAQLSPGLIATVGASAAVAAAQAAPSPAAATATAIPAGYQSLSLDEAAFVEALVNVMCPADHLTPNGVDCGLAIYMDRQLALRAVRQGREHQGRTQTRRQSVRGAAARRLSPAAAGADAGWAHLQSGLREARLQALHRAVGQFVRSLHQSRRASASGTSINTSYRRFRVPV